MTPTITPRYAQKRQTLIAAASDILNSRGVRGMILADVAAAVGFNTTSVTYYFRKKEDLAAACILEAVERFDRAIAEAAREATPAARVRRLLDIHVKRLFAIAAGTEPALAQFSDIRALGPVQRGPVLQAFNAMFRRLRGLLHANGGALTPRALNARANLLLEQLLWAVRWVERYDAEDAERLCARVFDILLNGLAPAGAAWNPPVIGPPEALCEGGGEPAAETFLRAATRLINQQGYQGASVEKISASLNVTKGSFYHHHEAKDDLVVACFERTYAVMRRAQRRAMDQADSLYDALTGSAAALVAFQLSQAGPLLRSSALSAVPEAVRQRIMVRADPLTDRFAAMISDGIAEGSVRPVDPAVAAQLIHATINAVADLPQLAPRVTAHEAVELFARPLLTGCLKDL